MIDALANWQWLISPPRHDEAVIVDACRSEGGDYLADGFARTRYFDPGPAASERLPVERSWRELFAADSLDCIATLNVDSIVGIGRRDPAAVSLLRAMRASLRAGEGVYIGFKSVRQAKSVASVRFLARHQQQLIDAGFSDVRTYYVQRAPTLLSDAIPMDRRSICAWDRAVERPGYRSSLRRGLVNIGLHGLFFPHRLVVGRA